MLKLEGKIMNIHVSILIDSGASLTYIAPRVVEKCNLLKEKQRSVWLVQLATGLKRKVTEIIKYCKLSYSDMDTTVELKILPLRSYDILIGIDWLESLKTIINCLHKGFDFIDEEGNYHTIKGMYRLISI